ncbi:MAG: hypothetical protein LBE56_12515 [Tannerella sp.]|jgi:hypothetical protein|nr:hypothetical protein [Tannerella sp.]
MEADEAANRFTLELMDRKVKLEIDLNDLKGKGRGIMYQAKKSLDKAYVMLEKLRSGELKKEKIARASGRANPTDTARRKVMVTDIMKTIED